MPASAPESSTTLARRDDELRALNRLAFAELGRAPGGIGGIHAAIADRTFGALGPLGQPTRVVHDAIARAVYSTLGGGAILAGRASEVTLGRRRGAAELPPLSASPRGSAVLAAINGLIGDELEREGNPLTQPMAVCIGGKAVAPDRASLARAFPAATPWPVVFLHGLMETEFSWSLGGREPYGARLARDLGVTPVYVRYNTGRRISENGRSLDELLEALFEAWPVEIEQIALVGHSMGGLVARSACWHGAERGQAWTRRVRHVVSLGSPHMGAPLEQTVHLASAVLNALPDTRPWGALLRRRSGGIRDLRHGSLVDEDWRDRDPEALRVAACKEIPLLDGATHCFVSATLTRSPRHPLGRLIGDSLVLVGSASGRSRKRRIPFSDEHGAHIGGASHFALLNHPQVYERLRDWLAAPADRAASLRKGSE